MIWGATLVAGAQAYELFGPGPQAESAAIMAAQKLVESFRTRNTHINCLEITELDHSSLTMQMITYFLIKGGTIGCFRMAANYAPVAFSEINTAFSDNSANAPASPVSCAALLAQKMGASERQTVMAAGLAGGIGLCGGACGVLGAAIWMIAMKMLKEDAAKLDFRPPRGLEAVDKFMKCTDYEFECSQIVGRKFESVSDHADYVRGGGAQKLLRC
jgi:type IV secretory pathway TrbD component